MSDDDRAQDGAQPDEPVDEDLPAERADDDENDAPKRPVNGGPRLPRIWPPPGNSGPY